MADRDEKGHFAPGHGIPGPGAPCKYQDEFAAMAYEIMAAGFSKTAAAGHIGIARSTFALWEKDHPGFSEAVKLGEAARTLCLERDLLSAADGPTVTSRIFALKNCAPDEWKDRREVDHRSPDGSMTPPTTIQVIGIGRDDSEG